MTDNLLLREDGYPNAPTRTRLGHMYIAKRPCGKVSAMSWDDAGSEKEIARSVAAWIRRGDAVERIERFEGDPQPEWACRGGCNDCRKPAAVIAAQGEEGK